jgi:hypothetical protein
VSAVTHAGERVRDAFEAGHRTVKSNAVASGVDRSTVRYWFRKYGLLSVAITHANRRSLRVTVTELRRTTPPTPWSTVAMRTACSMEMLHRLASEWGLPWDGPAPRSQGAPVSSSGPVPVAYRCRCGGIATSPMGHGTCRPAFHPTVLGVVA